MALISMIANAEDMIATKDLQHHNYILAMVDGDEFSIESNAMSPNIEFGENMYVSGKMCNSFFGKGELKDGVLTVDPLGMTRMFCTDDALNKLDHQIGQLLETGAKITLKNNGQALILSDEKITLEFKLKDYVN